MDLTTVLPIAIAGIVVFVLFIRGLNNAIWGDKLASNRQSLNNQNWNDQTWNNASWGSSHGRIMTDASAVPTSDPATDSSVNGCSDSGSSSMSQDSSFDSGSASSCGCSSSDSSSSGCCSSDSGSQ